MITWPSMAFIFPPGQMLTHKTQLHFEESQATCVFAQTPCKALGGAAHSGHLPAGRMKFSGLGFLEVGLRGIAGEPEITGMEASEFRRCGAVCPLGTWVKTLTTCCRRLSPHPTEPQAFLCEMGHHPQGAPPRVRAPTTLSWAAAQTTCHFAPLGTRSGTSSCHLRGPLLPNLPKSKALEASCAAGVLEQPRPCMVLGRECALLPSPGSGWLSVSRAQEMVLVLCQSSAAGCTGVGAPRAPGWRWW